MEMATTDIALIIAIVGTGMTLVCVMLAILLWIRGEANSDRRDIFNLTLAIQQEMRDFHDRLCAIEEKRGR